MEGERARLILVRRVSDKRHLRRIVLFLLMATVSAPLSLPMIFYKINFTNEPADDGPASHDCKKTATALVRNESVCWEELRNTLLSRNCTAGASISVINSAEASFKNMLGKLSLLGPSKSCQEAAMPFLCLYLFGGVCTGGSESVLLQPTSSQCSELRDDVCKQEWEIALTFDVRLPDCETFPNKSTSCHRSRNIEDNTVEVQAEIGSTRCHKDFFLDKNSGICVPNCKTWKENSQAKTTVINVMVILSVSLGFIASVANMVISFVRRKRIFVFPSIFVFYMMLDSLVAALLIIVAYMNRPSLYCTSPNLIESIIKVSPYCIITGMVSFYVMLQLALWWLFHIIALLGMMKYPFSFQTANKIRCIHVACIIAGLVIPLAPVITPMAHFAMHLKSDSLLARKNVTFVSGGMGFITPAFPPVLCSGGDKDSVFYSLALPLNIILILGINCLILLCWSIHREYKKRQSKQAAASERKIFLVLCYFIAVAVVALSSFSLGTKDMGPFKKELLNYFACEADGYNPKNPCPEDFHRFSHPILTSVSIVLLTVFPTVNLVYVVDMKDLKESVRRCFSSCLKRRINILKVGESSTPLNTPTAVD